MARTSILAPYWRYWDKFTQPFRGFRDRHPVWWRAITTVIIVAGALVATFFLGSTTNYNLGIAVAMSIVILGLSFLTGASGQVSIGNGAFMGVGAFTMTIWANHHTTTPVVVTLGIATLAGALIGLVIGIPATRLRGPYLAGMTLTFAFAFQSMLFQWPQWTGAAVNQLPVPVTAPQWLIDLYNNHHDGYTPPLFINNMWVADVAILTAGVAFFLMANLFASRTGRQMRLVRDNEVAAELMGVSLPRTRALAFVVSAAYAGLGGALTTIVHGSVTPDDYALALSITILSLLVIGGMGTLSGALIGGLFFAYSSNWTGWIVDKTGLDPYGNLAVNLKGIIFGVLLIGTMLVAPFGIAGTIKMALLRSGEKRRAARLRTGKA